MRLVKKGESRVSRKKENRSKTTEKGKRTRVNLSKRDMDPGVERSPGRENGVKRKTSEKTSSKSTNAAPRIFNFLSGERGK